MTQLPPPPDAPPPLPAQPPAPRPFRRSRDDKMIAGLCGGAARYTNLDPTLMRLLVLVAAFVTGGAMVPAYLIAWLIVPEGDPPVQP